MNTAHTNTKKLYSQQRPFRTDLGSELTASADLQVGDTASTSDKQSSEYESVLLNSHILDDEDDDEENADTESFSNIGSNIISSTGTADASESEGVVSQERNTNEWVVFSPTGTATPLAMPGHNGSGSFDGLLSEATVDRINQWRINQSQHILTEFQKLERRKWEKGSNGNVYYNNSELESWGIPSNLVSPQESKEEGVYTHDEIARALGSGKQEEVDDVVRLIVAALENVQQGYQQDVLDQALNAILYPNDQGSMASTPTPETYRQQHTVKPNTGNPIWKYITSKVLGLYDFIGMNDDLLEVILGERFIDPKDDSFPAKKPSSSTSTSSRPYSDYGNYLDTSKSASSSTSVSTVNAIHYNDSSSYHQNITDQLVSLIGNRESLSMLRTRVLTELFNRQQQDYAPDHYETTEEHSQDDEDDDSIDIFAFETESGKRHHLPEHLLDASSSSSSKRHCMANARSIPASSRGLTRNSQHDSFWRTKSNASSEKSTDSSSLIGVW